MTETKETTTPNPTSSVTIKVLAQHTKDLSFENLATSESIGDKIDPQISVTFDLEPRQIKEDILGLMLKIKIDNQNKTTEKKLFILELQYFITLQFSDMPKKQKLAALVIEGGRLAFPDIRNIVRQVTVDGGFAPFNLEPIDFVSLYREQMKKIQEKQANTNGADPKDA